MQGAFNKLEHFLNLKEKKTFEKCLPLYCDLILILVLGHENIDCIVSVFDVKCSFLALFVFISDRFRYSLLFSVLHKLKI